MRGVLSIALMAVLLLLWPPEAIAQGYRRAGSVKNAVKKTLGVVTSIAPIADFVRQVGGERVKVTLILPPGASPHTFEPTPRLLTALAKARIFIKIGGGLEFWADRIVAGVGKANLKTVTLIKGLKLLPYNSTETPHSSSHVTHTEAVGAIGAGDPHIWLDPLIAVKMIHHIADALSSVDPVGAPEYRKRANAYTKELRRLDEEIRARISKFSVRDFITFHNSWNYFAHRYGLRLAGVIEEAPGREPGPRKLAAIIRRIKDLKAKILFAEPQFSQRIAQTIAAEAGAKILLLDPLGGLPGRESYLDMMRYNVSTMEKGMR